MTRRHAPDHPKSRRPPLVARSLLAVMLPSRVRDAVLEEIDQRFARQPHPRRWYWSQALLAIRPAVNARIRGSIGTRARRAASNARRVVVEPLAQDLVYGVRALRRTPGFAALVVLMLGAGIGLNSTIFSIVNGVLLQPLPYDNAERLLWVGRELTATGESTARMQAADGVDVADELRSIEAVAIFNETTVGPMNGSRTPRHVKLARVSANLFDVLGVQPLLGRTFRPADGEPRRRTSTAMETSRGEPFAAVISHDLWQMAFGGDPQVLGRRIDVWGFEHVIVGVLPAHFRLVTPPALNLGNDIDVFSTWRVDYASRRREAGNDLWRVIALLRDDSTLAAARQEAGALSARLRQRHPYHRRTGLELRLETLQRGVNGPVQPTLLMLMGAVAFVLLIACANVANLLLARGTERAREVSIRFAIGASRLRVTRQLLSEAGVLAACGAALGIALAAGGIRVIHLLAPDNLPRVEAVRLDTGVLSFAIGLAFAATLGSGLLPALSVSRFCLPQRLRRRRAAGSSRPSQRLLVAFEVALSLVLLVGAGLMVRTLAQLQSMPLGFEPQHIITVSATRGGVERTLAQAVELERSLLANVRAIPGVEAAGIVFPLPMNGVYDRSAEFAHSGRAGDPAAWKRVHYRTVSPGYFDSMGLALRAGRDIDSADVDINRRVVVIDEQLAAREFPGRSPIGERIHVRGNLPRPHLYEIVGVVEYSPQGNHRDRQPTLYFHRIQHLSAEMSVTARVSGDAATVGPQLLEAVRATASDLPADLAPMTRYVSAALEPTRFILVLLGVFSGMAVLLAVVGLYAVIAYTLRRRTREIGIRMTLGASRGVLVRAAVGEGLRLATVGIGVGLLAWTFLRRYLAAQLYGVDSLDLRTLAATSFVLVAAAVAASYLPARRAAQIDPMVALRSDRLR